MNKQVMANNGNTYYVDEYVEGLEDALKYYAHPDNWNMSMHKVILTDAKSYTKDCMNTDLSSFSGGKTEQYIGGRRARRALTAEDEE